MDVSCKTCLYEGKYLSNLMQKNVCERCLSTENYKHWQPKPKKENMKPMNRLEDIRKRHDESVEDVNFRIFAPDIEYLLNEVERLKGALEKILNHGDDRPDCYPLYNIAEEALKES